LKSASPALARRNVLTTTSWLLTSALRVMAASSKLLVRGIQCSQKMQSVSKSMPIAYSIGSKRAQSQPIAFCVSWIRLVLPSVQAATTRPRHCPARRRRNVLLWQNKLKKKLLQRLLKQPPLLRKQPKKQQPNNYSVELHFQKAAEFICRFFCFPLLLHYSDQFYCAEMKRLSSERKMSLSYCFMARILARD